MPQYLSTDPNAGLPVVDSIPSGPTGRYLSLDPDAGLEEDVPPVTPLRSRDSIQAVERSVLDRALDLVPNRERLSEGIPGVLVGAAKQGLRTVAHAGDLFRAGWNTVAPDALDVDRPYQDERNQAALEPSNPYQQFGARGVQAAELVGAGSGLLRAATAVPGVIARAAGASTARAGANLDAVAAAARGATVNPEATGQAALRLMELAERGGSMPRAAQQFLRRVTDPAKNDLTFEEARDLYSNLSRLSAAEHTRLTPVVRRQVSIMREALHDALVASAETVGRGEQFSGAIREYARGVQLAERSKKVGTALGVTAAGAVGLDYLLNRLRGLVE